MKEPNAEVGSIAIENNQRLNIIINFQRWVINGPWHFEEDSDRTALNFDLVKVRLNFNYLVNIEGMNYLVHPDDLDYIERIIKALQDGQSLDYHFHVINSAGEVNVIHGFGKLITPDQPMPASRESTKAATLSPYFNAPPRLFKYIEQVAEMGYWTWNVKTNALYYSEGLYRIYGLMSERFASVTEHFSTYVHPDDVERVREATKLRKESAETIVTQYRIVRPDGEVRYLEEKSDLVTEDGDNEYFIGVVADITEKRIIADTKEQLLSGKKLLESVFDSTANGISVLKSIRNDRGEITDFQYVVANRYVQQLNAGIDLSGKLYTEIHRCAEKAGLFNMLKEVVEQGEEMSREIHHTFEGSDNWYRVKGIKLNDGVVYSLEDITERKKNEQEIRKKNDLLQRVLKAPNVGLVVYKALRNEAGEIEDFTLVLVSDKTKQLTGRNDMEGKRLLQLFPEKGQELGQWRKVVDTGISNSYETYHKSETGERWILLSNSKFNDGLVQVWEDITEKKLGEIALKKQKDLLQKCLDAIPQMVWIADARGKISFFNDRWYAYTGLTEEQFREFDYERTGVFHPSHIPDIKQKWSESIKQGIPYSGEVLMRNREGEYRWHLDLTMPIKNDVGGIEMWVGTFTDVHEQFTGEKKLKESRDLLEAIFNSSLSGIHVLDCVYNESHQIIDFEWRYYNKRIIISDGNDLLGKRVGEEFPESIQNGVIDRMKDVVYTGKSSQFEQRYSRKDGTERWYDISVVKLEDGVVLTLQDITDRKAAERELKERKHFIQQIANSIPDIIFVSDITAPAIIYVSGSTLEILGCTEDEVYRAGASIFNQLLHPDDLERRMRHIENLASLLENEVREMEVRMKVVDGSWHWFKIRETIFNRKDDGTVWQTIGIVQDVHDKKIAQEKIFMHHQIDRQAAKIANIGNWQWKFSTGEVTWAENLYRLLEREPGSVKPTFDFFVESVHPDDRADVVRESERLKHMEDGPLPIYNFRVIKKEGGIRYLRSASELITLDGERLVIGTVRDVTNDVIRERELRERVEFIETLIDSIVDRIMVYNRDLVFIAWNKKCEEFYKLKKEEVIGKRIDEIFPAVSNHPELLDRMLKPFSGEGMYVAREKSFFIENFYQETFFVPLKNEHNETYAMLNILHDITEQVRIQRKLKRMNESLLQKNKELAAMNEQLSTFAFVASHDLREPLRKIQVFSNSIIDNEAQHLTDRGKEYFHKILLAIQRMNALIEGILTFSRASAGSKDIVRIDLNEVVEIAQHDLSELIKIKRVVITCAPLPVILGNRAQFIQLFQNLISNAIKFQKGDRIPEVNISSHMLAGHAVNNPSASPRQNYIVIEVRDNGIGFEAQYTAKIFQMFQRLHGVHEFAGTGMGLAICKKIVENHQGFMEAKSEIGKGSVFSCYFPADLVVEPQQ